MAAALDLYQRGLGFPEEPKPAADREWLQFNNSVWPGISLATGGWRDDHQPCGDDLLGRLIDLHAITPEGVQAKVAAVLAAEDAASYGADARDDACELYHSALVDAAGPARMFMGEDASPPSQSTQLPAGGTT